MSKNFWIVLAVIVLGFIGFAILKDSGDSGNNAGGGTPTSHVKGSETSGVRLVEYGDFQCPACGAYYPTIKQVYQEYQDKIQFQFRNFPLTGIHQNAFAAARAAEAAGMQGKYWEMHDLLFENQRVWGPSTEVFSALKVYAQQLDLNMQKFEQDYKSGRVNAAVNADKNRASELDVSSTPTFFLNDEKLSNDQLTDENGQPSVEAFSRVIDAAITENQDNQPQSGSN